MTSQREAEWPRWDHSTVVVVGTGPGAAKVDFRAAQGRARIVVINQSWKLAPWADILYACDRSWWVGHRGGEGFAGLRVSASPSACKVYGLKQVRLRPGSAMRMGEVGVLGSGGNSGFQAVNLTAQLGSRKIILTGFDMTLNNGKHWHDDYRGTAAPEAARTERWRQAMDDAADYLRGIGVIVLNATPGSALRNYPIIDFEEALVRCRV